MDKPSYITQEDWDSVDSPPLTDAELAAMRPAREVMPAAFWKAWEEGRVGRPKSENPKQPITIRLDPDIIAAFKATGAGWQTRMNDVLRAHLPQN